MQACWRRPSFRRWSVNHLDECYTYPPSNTDFWCQLWSNFRSPSPPCWMSWSSQLPHFLSLSLNLSTLSSLPSPPITIISLSSPTLQCSDIGTGILATLFHLLKDKTRIFSFNEQFHQRPPKYQGSGHSQWSTKPSLLWFGHSIDNQKHQEHKDDGRPVRVRSKVSPVSFARKHRLNRSDCSTLPTPSACHQKLPNLMIMMMNRKRMTMKMMEMILLTPPAWPKGVVQKTVTGKSAS